VEYEEVIDALFKRGVTSPYELIAARDDLLPVERAIADYDAQKRRKPDATPGLLVWLIRNPPKVKPVDEYRLLRFKDMIKSRCLALEGNVRWAIEETYSSQALRLGTTIERIIDEVMWVGWEETPPNPDWAGPRSFANELERQRAIRFWKAVETRRQDEIRDQAGMGTGFGSTGLSSEGADEGDERDGEDH
jgi:hypothetical protein